MFLLFPDEVQVSKSLLFILSIIDIPQNFSQAFLKGPKSPLAEAVEYTDWIFA